MFGKESEQIPPVLAILVLNEKGERIAVQYSPRASHHALLATDEARKNFEVQFANKARKSSTAHTGQIDVVAYNDYLALYRFLGDASITVIGDTGSNEILLLELADALYEVLKTKVGDKLGQTYLLKRLDQVLLAMDEFVESGYVNELKARSVTSRMAMLD